MSGALDDSTKRAFATLLRDPAQWVEMGGMLHAELVGAAGVIGRCTAIVQGMVMSLVIHDVSPEEAARIRDHFLVKAGISPAFVEVDGKDVWACYHLPD